MIKLTSGGKTVRLAVVLAVTALALSWLHVTSDSTPETPARAAAPAAQVVQPGTTLLPAAPPAPAHVTGTATAQPARKPAGRKQGSAKQRQTVRPDTSRAGRRGVRGWWRNHGGRDISWPQCPRNVGFGGRNGLGQPMPDPGVKFVIVGLTNGRAFTPNPCLAMHLRWVRTHRVHASAYAFAAYPSRGQLRRYGSQGPYDGRRFLGALKNAGHAAARYNIRTMQRHGFTTPHVWLDVEPSSSRPWSGRRDWNREVVRGWLRAYRDAGYTVGVYSTPNLYRAIVGRFPLGLPEWRTAGPSSARAALQRCHGESIQGGPAVVAQWWTKRRDFNRICPGSPLSQTMARYFHKW